VPLFRLKFLLLGVFCLTGMIGCLLDVVALGSKPFADVIVWTGFTGLMAVIYLLLILRARRWLAAAIVLHIIGSQLIHSFLHRINTFLPHPDMQSGVAFAGLGSIILCFLSIVFFLLFFYIEGRYSIRLQTELQLAHDMQKTLVPVVDLSSGRWELYGVSLPSEKVGGDLVDLIPLPDGSLLAYVADISGHGLAAGILMGRFKTAARTCALDNPSLPLFLERMNRVLPQVKDPEMFATCAAVHLLAGAGPHAAYLEIAVAGHPEPTVFSSHLASVTRIADGSVALGLLTSPQFGSTRRELNSGDLLLVFTDGLIEIANARGEEFGWDRLSKLVQRNQTRSLKSISEGIFEETGRWGAPADDRTLLLIRARDHI